MTPDCGGVAFPLCNTRGTVVAAVSAVTHTDAFRPTRLAPLVSATADAVSRHARASSGRRMAGVGA
ncbi:hypothetical protein GCM10023083_64460 [Streptomyces phyllanthi]